MKKMLLVLPGLLLLFGIAGHADALVLNFDDISTETTGWIPEGYGGLHWYDFLYIKDGDLNSGYYTGLVSGEYVAYNSFGIPASFSDDQPFLFNGAYLTAAWSNGLNIDVDGYSGTTKLFHETVVVDTTGPTWFTFNYQGVDKVFFSSSGGDSSYKQFVMDNLTINEPISVPEPAAVLLFSSGFFGLIRRLRRKQ